MLTEFILSLLAATGFTTAWNRTNLKPKVFGVFFKSFRGKSYDEVTDLIHLRFKTFGQWINCPYCHSGYFAVLFFCLFLFIPQTVVFIISAFFATPLFIELVLFRQKQTVEISTPSERPQQPRQSADLFKPLEANTYASTSANTSGQALQKLMIDNQHIVRALSTKGDGCKTENCQKLVNEYTEELNGLLEKARSENKPCPDCVRGKLLKKYFNLILEDETKMAETNKAEDNG